MEEKKQTKKLSYSTFGKSLRGILCLVTFCAFVLGLILTIYAVETYGTGIFLDKGKKYSDTDAYQNTVCNDINGVMVYCLKMQPAEEGDPELTIMDVSKRVIYSYDKKHMAADLYDEYEDGLMAGHIEDLKQYQTGQKTLDKGYSLLDYEKAQRYFASDTEDCDYLYFDMNTFIELFKTAGVQNEGMQFSEDFSEEAYFVFQDVKETDDNYAVYDPICELFYSTWDDYFGPMDTYVYKTEEVKLVIEAAQENGKAYNSLLIPLLHSENGYLINWVTEELQPYDEVLNAEEHLEAYTDKGIYYYLDLPDGEDISNVDNFQKITSVDTYIALEKEKNGNITETYGPVMQELEDLEYVKDIVNQYPAGTTFYFGYVSGDETVAATFMAEEKNFYWCSNYSLVVAILTVVSFALLVLQAIWLLQTTGRQYKGDTEIALNFYDRFYTEIWGIIYIGVMGACVLYICQCMNYILHWNELSEIAFYIVVGALPLGFCFMVLTLSWARRIKAHNMWSGTIVCKLWRKIESIIVKRHTRQGEGEEQLKSRSVIFEGIEKGISKIIQKCKNFLSRQKGTDKLLAVFILYLILGVICVANIFVHSSYNRDMELAFWMYLLLQIVAVVVVVYIVKDMKRLVKGVEEITKGNLNYKVKVNKKTSIYKELADGINHTSDGLKNAIETSLKDERMKTELITNVSHDLKTPLTSIINYINLLKTEKMPTPEAEHYIEVLDVKSQRLKQLTEDLVEAAKATSGNIELEMMPLTFDELMKQALGEFEDKFEQKNLTVVATYPEESAVIIADGRRLFRIIENVLQNAYKYALEGTRIYADLSNEQSVVTFTLKNISAAPLNISAEELMERFTRGDESRTTEGSGLGLSIAKDLTRLQGGTFTIQLDGDLFKVVIQFPTHKLDEKYT